MGMWMGMPRMHCAGEKDISDFTSGMTAFYFGPLEYIPLVEEANPQPDYHVQGIPVQEERHCWITVVSLTLR